MESIRERQSAAPGIVVRRLEPRDLAAVIAVDARHTGHRRDEYMGIKLQQNLVETGVKVSLAAEVDGAFAGFLLARLYYGEFGRLERSAVLDTFGVHPDFEGRGVAAALLEQLCTNLLGLGVGTLQTTVDWNAPQLMTFFQHQGFRPAARFCLDLPLAPRG